MIHTFHEAACPAIGFESCNVAVDLPVIVKLISDAHDAPQTAQVETCSAIADCGKTTALRRLDYEEFIGAKKHLVLSLRSQTGPLGPNSFAIGNIG
jgi:hypothetical protein